MSNQEDRDRHVRRSGDDYAEAFLRLLPQGQAWPKHPGTTLERACNGLSQYWGYVDSRAADLLERESDPRQTIELLPDWEKAWGLPDPCLPSATTIAERQRMLVLYMTYLGGQSREYFMKLMEWLGFTIWIEEFAPFVAGISQVGDTRHPEYVSWLNWMDGGQEGPPPPSGLEKPKVTKNYRWYIGPAEQRFVWTVNLGEVALVWFRAASGQAGVDHHLEFRVPTEIFCLLDRWKPAHTIIVPDFDDLTQGGPLPPNIVYGVGQAGGGGDTLAISPSLAGPALMTGNATGAGRAVGVYPTVKSGYGVAPGVSAATAISPSLAGITPLIGNATGTGNATAIKG